MRKFVISSKGKAQLTTRMVLRERGAGRGAAHLYLDPNDPLAALPEGTEVKIFICPAPTVKGKNSKG
jgi:hypothetical protein